MGRYSTTAPASNIPAAPQQVNTYTSSPYAGGGHNHMQQGPSQEEMARMQAMQAAQAAWPKEFPKGVVGLDRDGTIIKDQGVYVTSPDQVEILPGALEGIRLMRLKGYRVFIITNQAGISKGLQTTDQVDAVHSHLMQIFGNAGIFSIDGIYYSTTNLKEDNFAKPNTGMFDRAKTEHRGIDWKKGWYVGDKISDLKAADRIGAKPILIQNGHWEETVQKLDTFANRDLKQKTKSFSNLLEFAESLP